MECPRVEVGWRKGLQFACGGRECRLQINGVGLERSLLLQLDYFSQGEVLALSLLWRTTVLMSAPYFVPHLCCLWFFHYLSTFLSHPKAGCCDCGISESSKCNRLWQGHTVAYPNTYIMHFMQVKHLLQSFKNERWEKLMRLWEQSELGVNVP